MSSLLQNVLASRLAQATLGGETASSSSDSAGDKSKTMGPPSVPASASTSQGLEEWESVDEAAIASDEEMVGACARVP